MVNGAVQCVVLLSAAWLSRHYNQTILFQFVRHPLQSQYQILGNFTNIEIGFFDAEYCWNSRIDG